jgi:hypothetical protein
MAEQPTLARHARLNRVRVAKPTGPAMVAILRSDCLIGAQRTRHLGDATRCQAEGERNLHYSSRLILAKCCIRAGYGIRLVDGSHGAEPFSACGGQ